MDPALFKETVRKLVKLPSDRWIAVENGSDFEIKEIQRAVVFILAVWSGPAHLMLSVYSNAMVSLQPDDVPMIVVDIDSISGTAFENFPGLIHGIGETYFVRGGVIAEAITDLIRLDRETVCKVPQPVDIHASIQKFSDFYKKVF